MQFRTLEESEAISAEVAQVSEQAVQPIINRRWTS
jgi:hypothetical protein